MSKTKRKAAKIVPLSDKSYIRSGRARFLPIGTCYINKDWKGCGLAHIFVTRKHVNGNITVGIYLVDLLGMGVKDTMFYFNVPESDLEDIFASGPRPAVIDYATVHNIIYGAIEFAENNGIDPHPDFDLTEMILEEDDDRIPFVEIEFGLNGKPVMVDSFEESDFEDGEDIFEDGADFKNWSRDEWEDFIENINEKEIVDSSKVLLYIFDRCYNEEGTDHTQYEIAEKLEQQDLHVTGEVVTGPGIYQQSTREQDEYMRLHEILMDPASGKQVLRKVETELLSLINEWPQNPIYYNLLSVVYGRQKNEKKLLQLCQETRNKFPDYLFGKTNYAEFLMRKQQYEMIPIVMGNHYTLKDMYPDRNTFHFSEFIAFHLVWCKYFCRHEDFLTARLYMNTMMDAGIPSDYPPLQQLIPLFSLIELDAIRKIIPYITTASRDQEFKEIMIGRLIQL